MVARCCRRRGAGSTETRLEQDGARRHGARATLGAPAHQSVKEFDDAFRYRARRRPSRLRAAGPHANHPKAQRAPGDDPLILTLARGHYCPKEHQQHLQLAAFYPQIAVAYTQIATIATDDHHTLQEFRASVGAEWPFLSDPERTVQKDLDIAEYTDP